MMRILESSALARVRVRRVPWGLWACYKAGSVVWDRQTVEIGLCRRRHYAELERAPASCDSLPRMGRSIDPSSLSIIDVPFPYLGKSWTKHAGRAETERILSTRKSNHDNQPAL